MSFERIDWNNMNDFNSSDNQTSYDNSKLNLKADKSYVDDLLVQKANKTDLENTNNQLNLKANIEDVNLKADKSYVDGELVLKADKSYTDTQLGLKANVTDLNTTNANVTNNTNAINTITQQVATIKVLTQTEYDALGSSKNTDNTLYLIKG